MACILARKVIWKAPATTLLNTLFVFIGNLIFYKYKILIKIKSGWAKNSSVVKFIFYIKKFLLLFILFFIFFLFLQFHPWLLCCIWFLYQILSSFFWYFLILSLIKFYFNFIPHHLISIFFISDFTPILFVDVYFVLDLFMVFFQFYSSIFFLLSHDFWKLTRVDFGIH